MGIYRFLALFKSIPPLLSHRDISHRDIIIYHGVIYVNKKTTANFRGCFLFNIICYFLGVVPFTSPAGADALPAVPVACAAVVFGVACCASVSVTDGIFTPGGSGFFFLIK